MALKCQRRVGLLAGAVDAAAHGKILRPLAGRRRPGLRRYATRLMHPPKRNLRVMGPARVRNQPLYLPPRPASGREPAWARVAVASPLGRHPDRIIVS